MRNKVRNKKQLAKWTLIALLAAALFFIGWFVAAVLGGMEDITDDVIPDSVDQIDPNAATATGAFNVLLLGTDKGDYRTDTIMLMRVDLDEKTIDLMSIMRDTRVKLGSGYNKINAVYNRDEMDGLIKCIKELTGSPVNYYALVDLAGFETIIDILGGVDFNVPQDMKYSDPYQNLAIDLKQGEQHLNGNQSMQLVRFRRYVTGDVERTQVQQNFVKAAIEQKLKPEYLLKLPELFREIAPYVSTNVTLSDVLAKSSALRLFTAEGAVQTHELPGMGAYVGSISYFLHDEAATYELCEQYFGGTGAPAKRLYTDYSSAAPMNPGGRPTTAPTSEPEEQETLPEGETLPSENPDPLEPGTDDGALPASADLTVDTPVDGTQPDPEPATEPTQPTQSAPQTQPENPDLPPDNGLF